MSFRVLWIMLLLFPFQIVPSVSRATVLGDVNADDRIDLVEAVAALQVVSGMRSSEAKSIQEAIDNLPADGGTVRIAAGTYILDSGIHINKSNVTIEGENGVVLKLGNHVNEPVILIGTDAETPTAAHQIQNIRIRNLEIDGNKDNQDSELDPDRTWIRNNGIDIRRADNVWIENVDAYRARSGGVVTSWNSDRIFIANSLFHHNAFDGIALYDGQDMLVTATLSYENDSAGISLDNGLRNVCFTGGIVRNNGKVGIFARNAEDIGFKDLIVKENVEDGAFISHEAVGSSTGVKQLFFAGCAFISNGRYGIWLASPTSESPDNTVLSCLFIENAAGCYNVDASGELNLSGCICK